MDRRLEAHVSKVFCDGVVPVMGATMKPIQCLVEKPVRVLAMVWVTDGGADGHAFIVGEVSVAKCIFTIALLQDTLGGHRLGDQEAKGGVGEYWCISLRFLPVSVLMIAQHHYPRLCPQGVAMLVGLDTQHAHGWNSLGDNAFAAEVEVSLFVDSVKDIVVN